MRIGELAKISGLAPSRIRFYEASGLIKSVARKANGYRDYGPDAHWVLQIITGAQSEGFSLEEIRQLLPMNMQGRQRTSYPSMPQVDGGAFDVTEGPVLSLRALGQMFCCEPFKSRT